MSFIECPSGKRKREDADDIVDRFKRINIKGQQLTSFTFDEPYEKEILNQVDAKINFFLKNKIDILNSTIFFGTLYKQGITIKWTLTLKIDKIKQDNNHRCFYDNTFIFYNYKLDLDKKLTTILIRKDDEIHLKFKKLNIE